MKQLSFFHPKSSSLKVFCLTVLFVVLIGIQAWSENITWAGANGTSGSRWADLNNWSPKKVPTSTDDVIINAVSGNTSAPIIITNAVCNSITINSSGSLTISSSGSLTVSGNWTNNGTFTQNSGTVTFTGDTNSEITGNSNTNFTSLKVNKGNDKSAEIHLNGKGKVEVNNSLTIDNGLLKINTGGALNLSGTAAAPTSGIAVNGGTYSVNGNPAPLTGTRTASVSGLWSSTATWGGESVPGADDDVVINTGVTVTMDVDASCNSVTTGTAQATAAISGSKTLTTGTLKIISGKNNIVNFSIGTGTTLICSTIIGIKGEGSAKDNLIVNGVLKNSGTTTALDAFTCNTGSTVEYSGADQTVYLTEYKNLILSGSGTKTAGGNITATKLDNGGSSNAAVILDMAGNTLSATIENTGATIKFSGLSNGKAIGTGTVEYSGTTQNITAGTYNNLILSGNGIKTMLTGTNIVNGNVTVESTATLNEAGIQMTLGSGSILTVNGTLDFTLSSGLIKTGSDLNATLVIGHNGLIRTADDSGLGPVTNGSLQVHGTGIWTTTSLSSNGTVEYNRNMATNPGQAVTARDYNNLILSGSGDKTISSGTTVGDNLSIAPTGGAKAKITTGVNMTVPNLYLGGLSRISGTWGATSTTATSKNDTFFNGPAGFLGIINVSNDNRTTPVITWANPADITYGTALSGTQLNATSVPGTFAYTPVSGTLLNAGNSQTLSTTFSPTDATSYITPAAKTVFITVNKKAITVSANASQAKVYGATDPVFTYTPSETLLTGNSWSGNIARVVGETVTGGPYAFNIGSLSAGTNYNVTTTGSNTFAIAPKALTITANNQPKCSGGTFTFAGTEFTQSGLINSDNIASVSLSSTGAAAGAAEGPSDIVPSAAAGPGLGNYTIGYVNGTMTVNPNQWTGANGTDWSLGSNWCAGVAPTSLINAVIPDVSNKPIIGAATEADCKDLKIESGASLTIASDATSTGSLIVAGNPDIAALGIIVQRYLPTNDWHLISSPVSGQALGAFCTANGIQLDATASTYDLGPYNEGTDVWDYPYISTTSETFVKAVGYSTERTLGTSSGLATFTGTGIYTGNPSIAISRSGGLKGFGWNCIGNPFTSAILATGTTGFLDVNSTQLDPAYASIYIWDNAYSNYQTMTNSGTQYLAVGQGFIVKAKTGGGSVAFNTNMQVHQYGATFKNAEIPWPSITLKAESSDFRCNTVVNFNEAMTTGLDPTYDAGMFKGNPNIALYSKLVSGDNPVDFSVQSLPSIETGSYRIPVGLDLPGGGEIHFTAETLNLANGNKVILEDTQAQTFTELGAEGAKYTTVVAAKTSGTGRFYLHTGQNSVTAVSNLAKQDFTVFTRDRIIYINGEAGEETGFSLYNIEGKQFANVQAKKINQNTIDASQFPTGIYLLRINNKGRQQVAKLVLMN